VVAQLLPLTEKDSDGDLLPDNQEGYNDSDLVGIPDYLDDAANDCSTMPADVTEQQQFLVQSDAGVCLRKGPNGKGNLSGALLLDTGELPVDIEASNVGGFYNFILYGLSTPGQSIRVVLPQRNALYRKYSRANAWVDFTLDDNNSVASSEGELSYCPPPNHDS
jgi:hypothetical protein